MLYPTICMVKLRVKQMLLQRRAIAALIQFTDVDEA